MHINLKIEVISKETLSAFQSLMSEPDKAGKASNGDAGSGADGDHLVVSKWP